jgi:hypothetical protein
VFSRVLLTRQAKILFCLFFIDLSIPSADKPTANNWQVDEISDRVKKNPGSRMALEFHW